MNILLVYPQYPDTFWSFKHALKFVSKKAAVPPLGLITVSAMFPKSWNKRLVDMNITELKTSDIQWSDYVFISAMYVQKQSVDKVIQECLKNNTKIVAGGPLFTQESEKYPQINHFVLNEGEITFPEFQKDLENGKDWHRVYKTENFADITSSPVPDFHLLKKNKYAQLSLQVTRGCPYSCDFCEITSLFGHKVRMKSTTQVLEELEALYNLGWRGALSIVDDNFIGNKKVLKSDLLPAITQWMQKHNYPFIFNIQASIEMADDKELMAMLTKAGFTSAFIGIETPAEESLNHCNKVQNKNRDLVESVARIQKSGIQVSGGFIVGFDSDQPSVFQRQIDFIQQSGIVSAMVGLLNAPKNTKLYKRLKAENRLTTDATGSNTDSTMNFIPKMSYAKLLEGYHQVIQEIYGIKPYYQRVRQFLLNYKRQQFQKGSMKLSYVKAFLMSILILGILKKGRTEYWKLLFWTLVNRPKLFADAVIFSVYGYHFRIVYGVK